MFRRSTVRRMDDASFMGRISLSKPTPPGYCYGPSAAFDQPDLFQLKISKQVWRQPEGNQLVHLKREQREQNLGFSSRPFVLCGLPARRPPAGQLLFERRNGHFVLEVTAHPNYGLPFGQDRIVPIFLATLAVRQQSQTIRFKSGAEMLDTFGMNKGGKEYRRLVAAFERDVFGFRLLELKILRVFLQHHKMTARKVP